MTPKTSEQQVEQALKSINQKNRLKGAPTFHYYELGKFRREFYDELNRIINLFDSRRMEVGNLSKVEQNAYRNLIDMSRNPELNAYTIEMQNQDEQNTGGRPLRIGYHYEEDTLILYESEFTTKQIVDHFYPINWVELSTWSDWELLREIIPAMMVASPGLKMYEDQRWLYDEQSQRAAETLSYRVQRIYPNQQLPEKVPLDDEQHRMMQEYELKLAKGGNPRRWFQEMKAKLSKNN